MNRKERLGHLAVYAAVRSAALLSQLMPVSWALALARLGAWLAHRLDARHRAVAADNLRHAFPDAGEAEIDRLARATYRHLFCVAVETAILLRRMRADNVGEYVIDADEEDRRFAVGLTSSERPTITLTGHLGNWEALNLSLGCRGHEGTVVARHLDNPYLDAWVRRMRGSTGMTVVDKDGAAEAATQELSRGGNVGLVGDQDAGPKGAFATFFGRPASTFKSIALLSLHHRAPILVLSCVRHGGPLRHRLTLEDAIMPEDYDGMPDAVKAITQRYTSALERAARRHPEQYFWLHRRWKSQPAARARPAEARRAA